MDRARYAVDAVVLEGRSIRSVANVVSVRCHVDGDRAVVGKRSPLPVAADVDV